MGSIKAGQQNRQSSAVGGNGRFNPHARVIEQLKTIIERYLKDGCNMELLDGTTTEFIRYFLNLTKSLYVCFSAASSTQ